jgi:hypothetical protein
MHSFISGLSFYPLEFSDDRSIFFSKNHARKLNTLLHHELYTGWEYTIQPSHPIVENEIIIKGSRIVTRTQTLLIFTSNKFLFLTFMYSTLL